MVQQWQHRSARTFLHIHIRVAFERRSDMMTRLRVINVWTEEVPPELPAGLPAPIDCVCITLRMKLTELALRVIYNQQ